MLIMQRNRTPDIVVLLSTRTGAISTLQVTLSTNEASTALMQTVRFRLSGLGAAMHHAAYILVPISK